MYALNPKPQTRSAHDASSSAQVWGLTPTQKHRQTDRQRDTHTHTHQKPKLGKNSPDPTTEHIAMARLTLSPKSEVFCRRLRIEGCTAIGSFQGFGHANYSTELRP